MKSEGVEGVLVWAELILGGAIGARLVFQMKPWMSDMQKAWKDISKGQSTIVVLFAVVIAKAVYLITSRVMSAP